MNINATKRFVARLHHYGINFVHSLIFYSGKIIGRFIFPFVLLKYRQLYIFHKSYYPECKLKSKFRIFYDQLVYIIKKGEINTNYFLFGFDRKDKNDFNNYVPWLIFTYYRNRRNQFVSNPIYDPYNYVSLMRDKFVFHAFCKSVGINTPENIGLVNNNSLYLIEEKKFYHSNELINLEFDALCKREISYGGGYSRNIFKLRIKNTEIFINDKPSDINKLRKKIGVDRWIIQKRIANQAPEYAQFHPQSINTIRIVTLNRGNSIVVLSAIFRMGVKGSFVDNWSSGGIIVGVDLNSGTLEKWGFFRPRYGTKCDRHPESVIIFENFKLPYWQDIVRFVKQTHLLFYGIYSVGWDVCMTTDGPMLIEGNDNWDTNDTQHYRGAKDLFKTYFKRRFIG